jgi:hypothetical protein
MMMMIWWFSDDDDDDDDDDYEWRRRHKFNYNDCRWLCPVCALTDACIFEVYCPAL